MRETRRARNLYRSLPVRADPLEWAEEISPWMVDVVRTVDGALILGANPAWTAAINAMLVMNGVRVSELARSS